MQVKTKTKTLAGIFLSLFGYIFVLGIKSLTALSERNSTILGLILIWLLVIILLAIVKWGEKRAFSSLGAKPITGKEILLAVGIGILLSLMVPILTLLVSQIIPSDGGDIEAVVSNTSWWMMLAGILTAGITEEIIFRGYLIERIIELTKKNWVALSVSLIAFVLPHTMSWNLTHVIAVVLPLGLILSGMYLWKRNLLFNMIIHIVIDLPLFVMVLLTN